MREIRQSGSEGGGAAIPLFLPLCALGSALDQEGESPSVAELPASNRK